MKHNLLLTVILVVWALCSIIAIKPDEVGKKPKDDVYNIVFANDTVVVRGQIHQVDVSKTGSTHGHRDSATGIFTITVTSLNP